MSESGQQTSSGDRSRSVKSADAFRTISEVSEELGVPQHVLRFWESKFAHVNPMKRGGGRRYYRPDDIRILERIRDLLYVDGFTIKGVQRLLREHGLRAVLDGRPEVVAESADRPAPSAPSRPRDGGNSGSAGSPGQPAAPKVSAERRAIQAAIAELSEIRKLLSPRAE